MARLVLSFLLLLAAWSVAAKEAPKPKDTPKGAGEVGIQLPDPGNPFTKTTVTAPKAFKPRPLTVVQTEGPTKPAEPDMPALSKALQAEAQQMNTFLGKYFTVQLLATNDPQVKGFIAGGLFKMNPDIYTRIESGLASTYASNGNNNGKVGPTCYIMTNPDRAQYLWRSYVADNTPTPEVIGWAARYLISHEAGHCMDRWQRSTQAPKGGWTADNGEPLGIARFAFDRAFGMGRQVDNREYMAQQVVLQRDGAQTQYQERVADAFAVLVMMVQKAPEASLKPIWDTRNRVGASAPYHAHFTTPTLEKAYALGMSNTATDPDTLWALARKAQMLGGIDPSLGPNSQKAYVDADIEERAPNTAPGQISKTGVMPQTIRFDNLPKFGARH